MPGTPFLARIARTIGPALILALGVSACSGDSAPVKLETIGVLKLKIIGMLEKGEFAALEKRLTALQGKFEAGKDPKGELSRAFAAFDYSDPALEKHFEAWVEKHPKSYAARLARGRYLSHLGWVARGQRSATRTTKAQFKKMTGYHARAMKDILAALKINPKLPSAYCEAIAIYGASGREHDIHAVFKSAERNVPGARCHIWRYARFLAPKWGNKRVSLPTLLAYAKSRAAQDNRYRILDGMAEYEAANALFSKHRHKDAVELYDKAIGLNPQAAYIRKAGRNLMKIKQYDAALAKFTRVLELAPEDTETLAMIAQVYARQGDFQRALSYADRALMLDPYLPFYLAVRLRVLRLGRMMDKAEADLKNALVFGADNPIIQAERGHYLGSLYEKPAAATRAWKRAVALSPGDSYFRGHYWQSLGREGKCGAVQAAVTYLRMCRKQDECGSSVLHVSRITNAFIRAGSCKYRNHHVALKFKKWLTPKERERVKFENAAPSAPTPKFAGQTDLAKVSLGGMKPGMSIEQVEKLYPGMKVRRMTHPQTKKLLSAMGLALRDDGRERIQVTFTPAGKAHAIDIRRTYRTAEPLNTILGTLVKKYGKPNHRTPAPKMGMVYREGQGEGGVDAALMFQVEHPAKTAGTVPGKGKIVRMVSVLIDNRIQRRDMKALSRRQMTMGSKTARP